MWTSPESCEFWLSPMLIVERVFAIVNDYEEKRTEAHEASQEYKKCFAWIKAGYILHTGWLYPFDRSDILGKNIVFRLGKQMKPFNRECVCLGAVAKCFSPDSIFSGTAKTLIGIDPHIRL